LAVDATAAKRSMLDDGCWFEEATLPSLELPDPLRHPFFEAGGTVTVKPFIKPGYPPLFSVGFRKRRG
jgi:hypothetical protein